MISDRRVRRLRELMERHKRLNIAAAQVGMDDGLCDIFTAGGLCMRTVLVLLLLSMLAFPASADTGEFSAGQHEIGVIVITELTIRDGMLLFRTDSGGCTDATSFVVDIVREGVIVGAAPHYLLTIRRIRVDDCKALLSDGVLIELDLETDLGLTGLFSISVENPAYQKPPGVL